MYRCGVPGARESFITSHLQQIPWDGVGTPSAVSQSMLAIAPRPSPHAPSILIVDPDADARLLYRMLLSVVGGTFIEAEDGIDALSKALAGRPDVIVMDTHLLRIDGYMLCSLLRQEQATRSAAIVLITSDAQASDMARGLDAGADEVLVKPCMPDDLVATAVRCWQRRRLVGER